jgi:hypothetical protein
VCGLVVILESTSQDFFDTEDLYFHSGETLTITAAIQKTCILIVMKL